MLVTLHTSYMLLHLRLKLALHNIKTNGKIEASNLNF